MATIRSILTTISPPAASFRIRHLYGCGTTCTAQRDFPETLKTMSLEQGKHAFCQRGDLVASVWLDRKPVHLLSTLAQADVTHTAQRKENDGSRISVQCLDTVVLTTSTWQVLIKETSCGSTELGVGSNHYQEYCTIKNFREMQCSSVSRKKVSRKGVASTDTFTLPEISLNKLLWYSKIREFHESFLSRKFLVILYIYSHPPPCLLATNASRCQKRAISWMHWEQSSSSSRSTTPQ